MPREKSIAERFAYVEKVGGRLYKPCRRFLREALFGLVENRSVLLSQIGRALDEPCDLIHTEKRLSRNLANRRYDDAAVEEDYLRLVAPILRDERYPRPTIVVDLTDIAKPRAKKMPYLARVWDGSKKELADGYEVVAIEAVGGARPEAAAPGPALLLEVARVQESECLCAGRHREGAPTRTGRSPLGLRQGFRRERFLPALRGHGH